MADIAAGIDLGTSNSVIGIFKEGKVNIVPNSIGDSITPSIVEILDKGEAVGEEIMIKKADEKHTITEIKRLIGKKYSEIKDFSHIHYNIISDNNDRILIKIERKGKEELYCPEEIMSLIFKKLIKNASNFIQTSINKAVITVPANFNYYQRSAITESAKLAGIEVLRIINEPTAAALAYGLGSKGIILDTENKTHRKVIVFDLGGGTFDVSILTIDNNSQFNVKASFGDTYLGGNDFDNKLVDFCIRDFCQKMGKKENDIKKDSKALKRLKVQCEKAKKKLSNNNSSSINVLSFFENINLRVEITRDRFNQECENLYKRIEIILDKVLADSQFKIEEINEVILIGGSSRIPKIKEILQTKFGSDKIRDNINQDEAVAIGATWQAHKLTGKSEEIGNINILDITPFTLGVAVVSKIKEERKIGRIMSVLIEKNSKIPTRPKIQTYKTIEDNQSFFKIKIYSGEEKFVKDNILLKEFTINNLPKGKAGTISLNISFEVDVNGILIINAEVESIGKKVTEKYTLYESSNSEKKIILKNSIKAKEIEKLDEIRQITEYITNKNEALKKEENNKNKKEYLNDLCESCLKLINIYESLNQDNDSENLYEKIFNYSQLLLSYYSKMIILDDEDKYTPEIIIKIKEIMPKFINDNIENLIDVFKELKSFKPKKYIEIVLFSAELLYKEGDKILNERKQFCRYYSKKFYQKAENIKKLIDEELIKKMDINLNICYTEIKKKYENKIAEINSFVNIIQDQVEGKKPPIFTNTGFTLVNKLISQDIMKVDDIYLILDIYQEMADSLSKGPIKEAEAFILYNIIAINFKLFKKFKKEDLELYDKLNGRIKYICEELEIDEDDEEKPKWLEDLLEINRKIEQIPKNEDNKIISIPEIQNLIEEIKNVFNAKMNEKKPAEFLNFILDKYPYINLDSSLKGVLFQMEFEEYFKTIFPKYHPDNYKDNKYYQIYNEIYMLLVKIEEKFFKKK